MKTSHFEQRCDQRNFRRAVDWILAYGIVIKDRWGERVMVPEGELPYLVSDGLPERQVDKVRKGMVILGRDGALKTVYHPNKPKRRSTSRWARK